jgi:hypothetical protein
MVGTGAPLLLKGESYMNSNLTPSNHMWPQTQNMHKENKNAMENLIKHIIEEILRRSAQ